MNDEEIVIGIKVAEDEVEKKVEAARVALARLRVEQAALEKERKAGVINSKEYATSQKAIATHMATANKTIQEGEQTLSGYAKLSQQAVQSINQMKVSVSLLGAAEQQLSSSQGIQERIEKLSAELKAEDAILKSTASSMDKLDEVIVELEEAYRGLSQAQREDAAVGGKLLSTLNDLGKQQEKNQRVIDNSRKGIKEYIRDVDVLGINVGATVDSFKNGAQGLQLFTKGMSLARLAAIAFVAIPIVAALSGLYILLTKSQKGMDFLAQATSGVSNLFSAFFNKVNAVIDSFSQSQHKLEDLAKFVETNLVNRFKALRVILDGILSLDGTKTANGMIQLATGAENAATRLQKVYDKGVAIAKLNQDIEKSEISLNTERARSEKIIERQKQIAEDTTKSIETRRTAEQAAIAESFKIQKSEEALQQKRIKLAKDEAKAGGNLREQQKKVSEEEAKLDEVRKNRIGERTELQNQLNSIEAEGVAKSLENAKKVAEEKVAIAEEALIQAKKNGEETIEIETEILHRTLTLIQARADAEKAGVEKGRGAAAQRKLIQAKADTEAIEATKQAYQKISQIIYSQKMTEIDTSLAMVAQGTKQELALRIKAIEAERNLAQEAAKTNIKDSFLLAEENARLVAVADRKINDARLEFEKQQVSKLADLENQRLQTQLDLGDQSLANDREIAAKRIDLEEETQIKLLELEKQYGQLSDADYLTRLNAIQAKALVAHKEANKQIQDADRDNDIAILDAKLTNVREGSKKELTLILDKLKKQRAAAIEAAKGDKKAIQAVNDSYDEQEAAAHKKHYKKLYDQVVELATQATSTLSTIVDASVARQTEALDQQYAALLSSASLSADARTKLEAEYQKKKDKIEKEANEKRKKIATAQNLINGAVAITKAFSELGPIGGVIATALILAQVAAQQVIIDSQKFARGGVYISDKKGGYIQGPGTSTSDSINARLSDQESVINANSTRMYYSQLSAINQAGGGKPFPGAGSPNKSNMFNLSHLTPKYQYGGFHTSVDASGIEAAVERGIAKANIRVGVDAITSKQKEVKYAEAQGNI